MYIKIRDSFFYLIIFIDEYSRYIVHHNLLAAMDADSVSIEAQAAIDNLTQKLIRPHTSEQNGIVERANKTMRESLVSVIPTDYEQARSEISRIIQYYNNNRRHTSLNYLTPMQYYRGNPE